MCVRIHLVARSFSWPGIRRLHWWISDRVGRCTCRTRRSRYAMVPSSSFISDLKHQFLESPMSLVLIHDTMFDLPFPSFDLIHYTIHLLYNRVEPTSWPTFYRFVTILTETWPFVIANATATTQSLTVVRSCLITYITPYFTTTDLLLGYYIS